MRRSTPPAPGSWARQLLLLLSAGALVWGAEGAAAEPDRLSVDQVPLGDLIEIVVLADKRELLAIDAEGGGASSVRLRLNERVLWTETRGLLGVVRTDERLLAIATRSASWQELDYERGEPGRVWVNLGDRVALALTPNRVIGFVGTAGRFSESRLGPREMVVASDVGANVAVVVTGRRALGLSPEAGGFFSIRMQLREEVTRVEASSNLATVHTDARILVFRSPTGTWEERRP